ncbi:MAG: prepilin-type N-terminal cleavage/methylation domain-containing protein, partial [Maioricimonas sp. JB049]
MKRTFSRATPAPRAAFTMIELLIVIVVIAILVALLLPAVGGARARARIAQVSSEIANLEKAIADFKLKYGINPPSRIVLCETSSQWSDDWDSSPPGGLPVDDADRRNSIAAIRQIWPQFGFGTGDMNGDGDSGDVFLLTGPECLLFFLGGAGILTDPGDSSDTPIANGFSANPGNPFASGGNRVGPFHEFDPARMVDLDGDGAWEYLDSLPN